MSTYTHIKRCLQLAERDIASVIDDRQMAEALLDQLALVSRPGDGAPKLLLVFAKLASSQVEWIDGAIRVEMIGDAEVTVVEVLSELGLGMHERVFPSFKMNVPLEEFARAVERVPHMVAPLTITMATTRRLVLSAAVEEREDDLSPEPTVSIGDDSLYRRRGSKDGLAAVKDPAMRAPPRAASSGRQRAVRNSSKSDRAPRPPIVPKAPPLPRTDERTPAPGPAPPMPNRSVVAKVPLSRIQVPRSPVQAPVESAPAPVRPSKYPKLRASIVPAKNPSNPPKPPERRSKSPPGSVAPKSARGRPSPGLSEPPDEHKIDGGWDDGDEE